MPASEFEDVLEAYHRAVEEFYKGQPGPAKGLVSRRTDTCLAGAFGGIAHGPDQVAKAMDSAASHFQAGETVTFQNLVTSVAGDVAYVFEIERFNALVGGQRARVALRATSIFRREEGVWRLSLRQGDPLVSGIDAETYRSLVRGES